MKLAKCFSKAKEAYTAHLALFKPYIVVDQEAHKEMVDTLFHDETVRARTTKAECLLIKALRATTKTLDKQQDSIKQTLVQHAKVAKVDPVAWFFGPVYQEAQRLLNSTPGKKANKSAKK